MVTVTNDDDTLTAQVPTEWEVSTGPDWFTVAPSILMLSATNSDPGVGAKLLPGQDDPEAALNDYLSTIGNTDCQENTRQGFEAGRYKGSGAWLTCDGFEYLVVAAARGTGSTYLAQIQATTDASAVGSGSPVGSTTPS
jgi:hypothetical protein